MKTLAESNHNDFLSILSTLYRSFHIVNVTLSIISISHLCGGSSQKTILKLVLFLYCILNPLINIHCLPFFFFLTLGQDSVSAHYKFNIVTELQI